MQTMRMKVYSLFAAFLNFNIIIFLFLIMPNRLQQLYHKTQIVDFEAYMIFLLLNPLE